MIKQFRLSKDQRESVCHRYIAGENSTKLSMTFGVSPSAICSLLKRRGVPIRSASEVQKTCELDESAFDVITPESAYWAGFLFADGCIFKRQSAPSLTLRLASIDSSHVYKFQYFMKSTHKILTVPTQNGGNGIQLQFRSEKIVSRLRELGMDGLNSDPIEKLYKSKDFWRGVIDGDGSIGKYRDPKSGKKERYYASIRLVGGYVLLNRFADFIKKIDPKINNAVMPHKSIFNISFGGKTAEKVISVLYDGAKLGLDRKVNAAMNILERDNDKEITRFTPYQTVKKILLKRTACFVEKQGLGVGCRPKQTDILYA
jgi:hypothetical protein